MSFTLSGTPAVSTLPSAQANSVQLLTPEGTNVLSSVSVSGAAVTVNENNLALAGSTTYTGSLSSVVGDTSGRTLAAPFTWSFTTAPVVWQTGATIGTFASAGFPTTTYGPSIASDASGNVFAVWQGAAFPSVVANVYSNSSGAWSAAPTTIYGPNPTVGNVGSLNLTSTPGGEPVCVWAAQDANGLVDVFMSSYSPTSPGAGAWSTPVITPVGPLPGSGPIKTGVPSSLGLISFNKILTVAATILAGGSNVQPGLYVGQYDQTAQTWGAIQLLAGATTAGVGGHDGVVVSADASGNITLAWPQNGQVVATTKAVGASVWPAPVRIDTLSSGSIDQIALAAGSSGTTITWTQTATGGQPTIQSARLYASLTIWSAPLELDAGTSPTGASQSAIVVDSAGYVDVGYMQSDGVYLVRYNPTSSTWSQPMLMSPSGATGLTSVTTPGLSVDSAGNVIVLYVANGTVYSTTYLTSTGATTQSAALDSGLAPFYNPTVLFGPDNVATASYYQNTPTGSPVRALRAQ